MRNKDQNIKNLENILSEKMMTRVSIKEKKNVGALSKSGYLSQDELSRLAHYILNASDG